MQGAQCVTPACWEGGCAVHGSVQRNPHAMPCLEWRSSFSGILRVGSMIGDTDNCGFVR
jgi:hypothetical protein